MRPQVADEDPGAGAPVGVHGRPLDGDVVAAVVGGVVQRGSEGAVAQGPRPHLTRDGAVVAVAGPRRDTAPCRVARRRRNVKNEAKKTTTTATTSTATTPDSYYDDEFSDHYYYNYYYYFLLLLRRRRLQLQRQAVVSQPMSAPAMPSGS